MRPALVVAAVVIAAALLFISVHLFFGVLLAVVAIGTPIAALYPIGQPPKPEPPRVPDDIA